MVFRERVVRNRVSRVKSRFSSFTRASHGARNSSCSSGRRRRWASLSVMTDRSGGTRDCWLPMSDTPALTTPGSEQLGLEYYN